MYVCICTYVYVHIYVYLYLCVRIYICIYACILYVRVKCINKKIVSISSTIVIKSGYFHMVGGFHASDGFSVLMEPPSQIILPDTN